MADFVYMTNAKNLKAILDRIQGAGAPPKFTQEFLKSLGFTSSTDRPVIGVLKALGFLSSDGVPIERYNAYRDASRSGQTLADGLRDGWSGIFLVDQGANQRPAARLTELFKSVSGKGDSSAKKMATTFKILCDMADWSATTTDEPRKVEASSQPESKLVPGGSALVESRGNVVALHHDVHIHLPPTSDVSVFTAIFRALKAELLD